MCAADHVFDRCWSIGFMLFILTSSAESRTTCCNGLARIFFSPSNQWPRKVTQECHWLQRELIRRWWTQIFNVHQTAKCNGINDKNLLLQPHSQSYVTKPDVEILFLWEFSHNSHRPIDRSPQNTKENPCNARAHQHSMAAKHLASRLAYLIFLDFTFPFAIAATNKILVKLKGWFPTTKSN